MNQSPEASSFSTLRKPDPLTMNRPGRYHLSSCKFLFLCSSKDFENHPLSSRLRAPNIIDLGLAIHQMTSAEDQKAFWPVGQRDRFSYSGNKKLSVVSDRLHSSTNLSWLMSTAEARQPGSFIVTGFSQHTSETHKIHQHYRCLGP